MDRKGFFKTLGFLGIGIIASKVIPEIKDKPIEKKVVKSMHRNDAKVWFQDGEARIDNDWKEALYLPNEHFGEINKMYIIKNKDIDKWPFEPLQMIECNPTKIKICKNL